MPAGLIDEKRRVCARRDLSGDFGQVQVHGLRLDAPRGSAAAQSAPSMRSILSGYCAERRHIEFFTAIQDV
jgi:hypothetical protein